MRFVINYSNYRELMKAGPEEGIVLLSADAASQMVALSLEKEIARVQAKIVMVPGYMQIEISNLRKVLFHGDEVTFTCESIDAFRYYSGTVSGKLP